MPDIPRNTEGTSGSLSTYSATNVCRLWITDLLLAPDALYVERQTASVCLWKLRLFGPLQALSETSTRLIACLLVAFLYKRGILSQKQRTYTTSYNASYELMHYLWAYELIMHFASPFYENMSYP